MAEQHSDAIARIRASVAEARALQEDAVMFDASATEARLEQTVRELQARVEEQQSALDHVRSKQQTFVSLRGSPLSATSFFKNRPAACSPRVG